MAKYIDMTHHKGTSLTQHGREEGIRRLMSINLLKRLESSVYSFWLTIERIKMLIDSTIEMIDRYQSGNLVFDLTEITDSEDFDYGMIDGYINNGSKSAERSSKASIRVTKTTVEVFYHGSRVASHRRLQTRQRDPMVKREHMPPEHQKYLTYNADEFSRWAMSVGPMTEKVAEHFLKSGKAAEQGYKACAGLTKLEQRYGKQRLEAACGKALAYSTAPSLRTIASILKNGLDKPDKAESQLSQSKANSYGITRGAAYFRKGGDR